MQDCSNSIANALELLQYCIKPSISYLTVSSHWCLLHYGIMAWKHFPHYWPFVRGIHWWPVDSPHKGLILWNFDSLFVKLNNLLNNHYSCQWFEMLWWPYDITGVDIIPCHSHAHRAYDYKYLCAQLKFSRAQPIFAQARISWYILSRK